MNTFQVVINPSSGSGNAAGTAQPVIDALRARGARVRTTMSPGPQAADALVAASAAAGERCIAVGGDGMVSSMVGPVFRYGVEFGIIPAGRGNDFARQLGVPVDPEQQASALLAPTATAVDAIAVADRVVAGSVYAGVDSRTSQIVNGLHRMPTALQYPYGAVRSLATFPRTAYTVTIDGAVHRYEGFTVVVANSGYYGKGMHIAPGADVRDGLLDVVMIAAGSRARFIARLPSVYRGMHVDHPEITVLRGRTVTIEAPGVVAYADGEPVCPLPVTADVLPAALRMLLG